MQESYESIRLAGPRRAPDNSQLIFGTRPNSGDLAGVEFVLVSRLGEADNLFNIFVASVVLSCQLVRLPERLCNWSVWIGAFGKFLGSGDAHCGQSLGSRDGTLWIANLLEELGHVFGVVESRVFEQVNGLFANREHTIGHDSVELGFNAVPLCAQRHSQPLGHPVEFHDTGCYYSVHRSERQFGGKT